jgi:WD40 repeat protein
MPHRKLLTITALLSAVVTARALDDAHGDPLPAGAHARLGTIRWRHGGLAGFVAFSPDGKRVLSAADDRLFRLWDYPSGKEIRRFGPQAPDDRFRPVSYGQTGMPVAVTRDGKVAACYFEGNTVRLYEVATGKELPALKDPTNPSGLTTNTALEFSPDGRHLAVRQFDTSIRVWDWAAVRPLAHFNQPPANGAIGGGNLGMTFSPDGKLLAIIHLEFVNNQLTFSFKLWDPKTGREVRALALPQNLRNTSLPVFSPDGKTLAYDAFDGTIGLLQADTGKEVGKIQVNQGSSEYALAFSRDGKTLFTRSCYDRTVEEFDVGTGKSLRRLGSHAGHRRFRDFFQIYCPRLAFSPDGGAVALAGLDYTLHFIDIAGGKELPGGDAHVVPVQWMQFSATGDRLRTQSSGPTVHQWDPATGKELGPITVPFGTPDALIDRAGKYLVTWPRDEKGLRIHEVATGQDVGVIPGKPNDNYPAVAFSPDGKFLAVRWARDQKLALHEVPSGKLLHVTTVATGEPEPGVGLTGPLHLAPPTMIFSRDGGTLAAYSAPQTLTLWDTRTGRRRGSLTLPVEMQVQSGAFAPDGHSLALDMRDGTVVLWEVASGKQRRAFGAKLPAVNGEERMVVRSFGGPLLPVACRVAFSPDGRRLIHAGYDRAVHVWDVVTGAEDARLPSGAVHALALAPDGKKLASAGSDTTALLWDLSAVPVKPLAKRILAGNELAARWEIIKGDDAAAAFSAICDLTASPAETVAFLKTQLKPAPALDAALVEKLIVQVGDSVFRVRQRATAELLKLGDAALPAIEKRLAAKPSLEVKTRLEEVRERLTRPLLTGEKLQVYRALEVLEGIGTPEARQVLETLAGGAPGAFVTTTARAALARLR